MCVEIEVETFAPRAAQVLCPYASRPGRRVSADAELDSARDKRIDPEAELTRIEGELESVTAVEKVDLDLANHLSGVRRTYLKLSFRNVQDLISVKRVVEPIVRKNAKRSQVRAAYGTHHHGGVEQPDDFTECLLDIREYDVPYHVRVMIDMDIRVGAWYKVSRASGSDSVGIEWLKDKLDVAEPRILAFDIECTKAPLKFPDAEKDDQIFMISYMFDGQV